MEEQQQQPNNNGNSESVTDSIAKIKWVTVRRKPSTLKFHPKNPRDITDSSIKEMQQSIAESGYMDLVAVNLDHVIVSGHRRVAALMDWDLGDEEIEVRMPSRLLSPEEHEKLMIKANKMQEGHWNFDMLNNNWDLDELKAMGFTEQQLGAGVDINTDNVDKDIEDNDPTTPKKKSVTCPHCGTTFEV